MQNNHISLARKYRPKNLCELKAQDVLVKTLSNAIKFNKLAQSYLLAGIRGVGKTTTARIIAKTVNCTSPINLNFVTPCEECNNCISASNGSHPDILEIDAASRTGVDDVRIIIENSEYKPMMGNYKIFIIDEVHMLSKSAFNALLKLLEEPPSHCIFIFATTEVYKIPLTIISRCQRFDLARFSNSELEHLIRQIADVEKLVISDEAIKIIALKADGSARDGLSLLDQAVILSKDNDGRISKELTEKMVSSVDHKIIIDFLTSIISRDAKKSIELLNEFYKTNTDFNIFLQEFLSLLSYLAKKLVITGFTLEEFYAVQNEVDSLVACVDDEFVQIAWQISFKTESELKQTFSPLQSMEMLALKLIYILSKKNGNFEIAHQAQSPQNLEKNAERNLSFQSFLQFLSSERDFHILFEILNKSELAQFSDSSITLVTQKPSQKFEFEVNQKLNEWAGKPISLIMNYKENIRPYKDMITDKLKAEPSFTKILNNFSEVEIIDILVSTKTIN